MDELVERHFLREVYVKLFSFFVEMHPLYWNKTPGLTLNYHKLFEILQDLLYFIRLNACQRNNASQITLLLVRRRVQLVVEAALFVDQISGSALALWIYFVDKTQFGVWGGERVCSDLVALRQFLIGYWLACICELVEYEVSLKQEIDHSGLVLWVLGAHSYGVKVLICGTLHAAFIGAVELTKNILISQCLSLVEGGSSVTLVHL